MKGKLYRAGLLPYLFDKGELKFLTMKPADQRYGGDRFQMAKGKIEPGESASDAALREASEELGLRKRNIRDLTFLGTFLGRTSVFLAGVKDVTDFGEPHFETAETAWLTLSEFEQQGRSLHTPILREAALVASQVTLS